MIFKHGSGHIQEQVFPAGTSLNAMVSAMRSKMGLPQNVEVWIGGVTQDLNLVPSQVGLPEDTVVSIHDAPQGKRL